MDCLDLCTCLSAAHCIVLKTSLIYMVFECDSFESMRDRHRPLFDQCYNGDPPLAGGLSPVGRSMAEFMNQNDAQRLSSS
jgi:hypothetical protein